MGEAIDTGDIELWTERRGQGPDVLLIAGLGDPAEAWQPQLDGLSERYLVTAFDNRGAGRTPLPEGRLSASSTSSCRRASVDRSPRESRTRASTSCPGRHTSLPGGPGRVQRPRRGLLARGRDAGLRVTRAMSRRHWQVGESKEDGIPCR
jgi:hypothetical protein